MAVYHVKSTGTKTTGASTIDDWTDANCYPTYDKGTTEAGSGDTIILYDEDHTIASTLSGGRWQGTASTESRSGDSSLCNLSIPESRATSRGILFNPTGGAGSHTFNNVGFTRVGDVTGTNVAFFECSQLIDDITFNDCDFHDIAIVQSGADTLVWGGLYTVHTGGTRTLTFNNTLFRNISLTGGSGGSVLGRSRAGAVVTYDGCAFSDLSNAIDGASSAGFIYQEAATLNFNNNTLVRITSTQVATTSNNLAFLLSSVAGSTLNIDNVTLSNLSFTGGRSGAFFGYARGAYTVAGVTATDCISTPASGENTVGGLFLALDSTADGTLKNITCLRVTSDYGPAWYGSNGGTGTLEAINCVDCETRHGVIYSGGDGDLTVDGVLIVGTTRRSSAISAEKGLGIYAHIHSSTGARNKTVTINNVTVADSDTGFIAGIRLANNHATFTLTATIKNSVLASGGLSGDEILSDGSGTITTTTDTCSIEGGAAATNGVTNNNIVAFSDADFVSRTKRNYELSETSNLVSAALIVTQLKQSANGEPFPSYGVDIGGLQSTHGPFHPTNL